MPPAVGVTGMISSPSAFPVPCQIGDNVPLQKELCKGRVSGRSSFHIRIGFFPVTSSVTDRDSAYMTSTLMRPTADRWKVINECFCR